jgi:hypothetical protein
MATGRTYLLRFLGIILGVFLVFNLSTTYAYLKYRYRSGASEWSQKTQVLEHHIREGKGMNILFVGDSTVSCGISPGAFDRRSFNLAWSGFEPSELNALKKQILALPQRPRQVFIGINPSFLSQNEWRNSFDLPYGLVAWEALKEFYSDSNSMKPFLVMGGASAVAARFLQPPKLLHQHPKQAQGPQATERVEADGLLVADSPREDRASGTDVDLRFRPVNFRMLRAFRGDLMAVGIRVSWIRMPYSLDFEQTLRSGKKASRFMAQADQQIKEIFGTDVIDLRGCVPDSCFRDQVHLNRHGAELLSRHLGRILGFEVAG